MTTDQALAAVAGALATIAPEVDPASADRDAPYRSELDLDSLDFLNLVQALHDATGVDIPEVDYARIDTLNKLSAYLVEHSVVATR